MVVLAMRSVRQAVTQDKLVMAYIKRLTLGYACVAFFYLIVAHTVLSFLDVYLGVADHVLHPSEPLFYLFLASLALTALGAAVFLVPRVVKEPLNVAFGYGLLFGLAVVSDDVVDLAANLHADGLAWRDLLGYEMLGSLAVFALIHGFLAIAIRMSRRYVE